MGFQSRIRAFSGLQEPVAASSDTASGYSAQNREQADSVWGI